MYGCSPRAIIITPTRELGSFFLSCSFHSFYLFISLFISHYIAFQVESMIKVISSKISTQCIYGGTSIANQGIEKRKNERTKERTKERKNERTQSNKRKKLILTVNSLKEGVDIIVGTPGRIKDHLIRETLKLDKTQFLVFDEADQMLSLGFKDQMDFIVDQIPEYVNNIIRLSSFILFLSMLFVFHLTIQIYLLL